MGASFYNSTNGYYAGGEDSSGNYISAIDKLNYSADTISTLGTGLSNSISGPTGFSSPTSGYVAGGVNGGGRFSTVDKFLFSNDSRTTLGTGLAVATYGAYNNIFSTTAGYMVGGTTAASPGGVATAYKFTFSDDSRSTLSSALATASYTDGSGGFSCLG
jgi:hypothetical protein